MTESTLAAKDQANVPADVRAFVQAPPGSRLVWSVAPDGTILVRVKSEDMNPWR